MFQILLSDWFIHGKSSIGSSRNTSCCSATVSKVERMSYRKWKSQRKEAPCGGGRGGHGHDHLTQSLCCRTVGTHWLQLKWALGGGRMETKQEFTKQPPPLFGQASSHFSSHATFLFSCEPLVKYILPTHSPKVNRVLPSCKPSAERTTHTVELNLRWYFLLFLFSAALDGKKILSEFQL